MGLSYRSNLGSIGPSTGLLYGTFVSDQSNTKLILGTNLFFDNIIGKDRKPVESTYGINGKIGVVFSEDPLYGGVSAALSIGYKLHQFHPDNLFTSSGTQVSTISENLNQSSPDIGLGVFFHKRLTNEDNFYSGISVPQLFSINSTSNNSELGFQQTLHLFGTLGYIKYLNDYSYLETTSWIKYVKSTPTTLDLNVKYQMDQNIWIGAGASTTKAFRLECGLILGENIGRDNPFKIGYSYEDGYSLYYNNFSKTHEISLHYSFATR